MSTIIEIDPLEAEESEDNPSVIAARDSRVRRIAEMNIKVLAMAHGLGGAQTKILTDPERLLLARAARRLR